MQISRPQGILGVVWRLAAVFVLIVVTIGRIGLVEASPAAPRINAAVPQVVPDWMSDSTALQLDLGFDVLVPKSVPAPFAGEPSIQVEDGYYSLYWMVPGTPPTFLQITGEVGGEIPDYSKADRNNELTQNATVGDVPAYHDQTDIYDLVYWELGGIVYSVESRNLADTDSLTLASKLVLLTPPVDGPGTADEASVTPTIEPGPGGALIDMPTEVASGDIVTIAVTGPADSVLDAGGGEFPDYEGLLYYNAPAAPITWRAPEVGVDTEVTFLLRDNYSWEILTQVAITVKAKEVSNLPVGVNCPTVVAPAQSVYLTVTGGGYLTVGTDKGTIPGNVLNNAFGTDGDGTKTAGGVMPDSGIVTINFIAPAAKKKASAKIQVYNADAKVVATCKITIDPSYKPEPAPSGDSSEFAGGDGTNIVSTGAMPVAQPTAQPTNVASPTSGSPAASAVASPAAVETAAPTNTPEPTVIPTATLAPAQAADGTVGSTIGPEGGSLSSPSGVTIIIPVGALTEVATVTIRPKSASNLPSSDTILLVPNSAVEIAFAAADGKGIESLAKPATLQMTFDEATWADGMQLYLVNGTALQILQNQTSDPATRTVSAEINSFSLFAAGRPVGDAGTGTGIESSEDGGPSVVVLALGALLGLIVLTTVFSVLMGRGGRTVRPKR